MRILCIMEAPLGSHKAHAINVVKTAGGFSLLGHEVFVLAKEPESPDFDLAALLDSYGESGLHPIVISGSARMTDSQYALEVASITRDLMPEFVFARSFGGALVCGRMGLRTVMETHAHAGDLRPIVLEAFTAAQQGHISAIVTISHTLKSAYIQSGAPASRVHVVPDGVDPRLFLPPASLSARGVSPYSNERGFNAVYAGHLYDYKGIPCILDAAAHAPNIQFHLVGGLPEDIARIQATILKRSLHNVEVHGHVSHTQVPRYLWHADALLLPYSSKHPSAAWTSPVKLGEYIASQVPIIASRIPGLEAWVDEPVVQWVTPDDPQSLVNALEELACTVPIERSDETRASACLHMTQQLSYAQRAASILRAGLDGELQVAA